MASLGRIGTSLVSATNENTLALASLNFDFSMVKIQAPKEYTDLGHALGVVRRENAENGTAHRTARKLGALFEALMPSTPKLIAAYGTRCSEIMQAPGVNPSGTTEQHGAFAGFVGADATSIWAAATSGATAISIHLLACLLARSFNDPAQAASVWAELVAERQREILSTTSYNTSLTLTQIAALNAANQEISRQDLRRWDASARAWLQTADSAKNKEYTQLKLILKNITLPVTGGSNLYGDVTHAWKQAMTGVESLLNGQPQSVTDGGIILAISSWHVFPNLMVLGPQTTSVSFGDPLMPSAGLLTLGITTGGDELEEKPGIYWSIPLSHHRYYGKPVKAVGEIGDRLTMDELHLVALGSILRHWNTPRDQIDLSAQWFISLWRCLGTTPLRPLRWLEILAKASNKLLSSDESSKRNMMRLVDFGYRRGRNFLFGPSAKNTGLPWFGLRCRHILRSLCSRDGTACAIEYLRCMADVGGLGPLQALITHIAPNLQNTHRKRENHNYYTAVGKPMPPRNTEAVDPIDKVPELEEDTHKGKQFSTASSSREDPGRGGRGVEGLGKGRLTYDSTKKSYVEKKHSAWMGSFQIKDTETVESMELPFFPLPGADPIPPRIFGFLAKQVQCYKISPPNDLLCDCDAELLCNLDWFPSRTVQFRKCMTDSLGLLRMYITTFSDTSSRQDGMNADTTKNRPQELLASQMGFEEAVHRLRRGAWEPYIELKDAISIFEKDPKTESPWELAGVNPYLLWQFLEGLDPLDVNSLMKSALDFMHVEKRAVDASTKPLRDLVFAQDIYKHLDGATVSSAIVEFGIHRAKWCAGNHDGRDKKSLVFSCVAMMETGTVNIDGSKLDEVFAVSYGNSIFISSRLLTDPSIDVPDYALTRIVGNVGRPGLSLLIPPPSGALLRPLSTNYRAVSYEVFDGKRQDNFKGTSLHMSFTSHEFPLDYGANGIIDHQVFLVESVVSVYDSGKWVGDLNISRVFQSESRAQFKAQPRNLLGVSRLCRHTAESVKAALVKFSVVDTWEEVLDTPPSVAVIRARKNWYTRLAAYTIINQGELSKVTEAENYETAEEDEARTIKRKAVVVKNDGDVCWACVYKQTKKLDEALMGGALYIVA
ncbi:hypothetical protein NUW58_g5512 [Xylaria curta]|uniref:Uncharacterized protein n=1 Tax=Xylaria curta TaxID=42375 RepID=A0ACC1P172_9PEZI|nr:hypothetical protein NUW58_g5512 [Xylaria curta]